MSTTTRSRAEKRTPPVADPPEPELTTLEVVVRYGISYNTLIQWRHQKRGPAFLRLPNNRIRYRESDIEAYLAACRTGVRVVPGTT